MINEAHVPSSACRLWRIFQVETSTPPSRLSEYRTLPPQGQGRCGEIEKGKGHGLRPGGGRVSRGAGPEEGRSGPRPLLRHQPRHFLRQGGVSEHLLPGQLLAAPQALVQLAQFRFLFGDGQ